MSEPSADQREEQTEETSHESVAYPADAIGSVIGDLFIRCLLFFGALGVGVAAASAFRGEAREELGNMFYPVVTAPADWAYWPLYVVALITSLVLFLVSLRTESTLSLIGCAATVGVMWFVRCAAFWS